MSMIQIETTLIIVVARNIIRSDTETRNIYSWFISLSYLCYKDD